MPWQANRRSQAFRGRKDLHTVLCLPCASGRAAAKAGLRWRDIAALVLIHCARSRQRQSTCYQAVHIARHQPAALFKVWRKRVVALTVAERLVRRWYVHAHQSDGHCRGQRNRRGQGSRLSVLGRCRLCAASDGRFSGATGEAARLRAMDSCACRRLQAAWSGIAAREHSHHGWYVTRRRLHRRLRQYRRTSRQQCQHFAHPRRPRATPQHVALRTAVRVAAWARTAAHVV